MALPLIASIIIKKGIGKHIVVRASARRHIGIAFKAGHEHFGIMANKTHTRYLSRTGRKWYFRRKL